jgi:hypothetical protein
MSGGLLLVGVIEAFDKRRWAFFWAGEETCTGGQCKVAWSDVCSPKHLGGLGVLSIPSQNSAFLSKFLSKLQSTTPAPWASWFRRMYGWAPGIDLGDSHHLATPVWKGILAGLPSFRSLSLVTIGSGASTSFWFDSWVNSSPLAEQLPALFSHCHHPNANVASIFRLKISSFLVPRLSPIATAELSSLNSMLASVVLRSDAPDTRLCRVTNKSLSNKDFYLNTFRHIQQDDMGQKLWKCAAPLKCKIFIWLLHRRRLPTNVRRFPH